jgi:hypothetical protein
MDSSRYPRRTDRRAKEPDAPTNDAGRRQACGAAQDAVWIYLCDIPAANIAEYGRVMPPPGKEDAWFSSLPDAMRERPRPLA